MIEPKGSKPGAGRLPDTAHPDFELGGDEQPMYATEPEIPDPHRGSTGTSGASASYGGGWEVPGKQGPSGEPPRGNREPPRGNRQADQTPGTGQAGEGGQGGAGGGATGQGQADTAEPAAAGDAADQAEQGRGNQGSASLPQGGSSADGQAELKALLTAAEANAKENHEQYLRALAEMENVRRRAQDDVSKAHKYAIESFAESMLPVRDSLEMALTVEVPSVENLREGVEATLRQLTSAFERNRVVVIDPLHQKFDPNLHQAISMAPSKDVAPNHVVSVLQKGYMINDRILRPALVTVSKPA